MFQLITDKLGCSFISPVSCSLQTSFCVAIAELPRIHITRFKHWFTWRYTCLRTAQTSQRPCMTLKKGFKPELPDWSNHFYTVSFSVASHDRQRRDRRMHFLINCLLQDLTLINKYKFPNFGCTEKSQSFFKATHMVRTSGRREYFLTGTFKRSSVSHRCWPGTGSNRIEVLVLASYLIL